MIGPLILLSAAATAMLFAASTRPPSLTAALLVAYLGFVSDLTVSILVLSPERAVTHDGLAIVQALLLAAALAAWWRRGRPRLPLAGARRAVRAIARDPVTLVFLCVVLAALAYELALGLTEPANDYDGLAYHLARAAAWAQHGGYFWVPNAPMDPINEYPPIAEQQILFYFAAVGRGLFFTLPQLLAELAILTAVYGSARRLGFDVRAAVCGACLFATFGLVALESTTSQNDLVAASFPVVAAFMFLGDRRIEHVLGGVATGIGLGVKLTTVLVVPLLLWLVSLRGRRAAAAAVAGALGSFATLSVWVFVLNVVHTGRLLGHGGGRVENSASPSYPDTISTALHVLYSMLDLSVLSNRAIRALGIAGAVGGLGVACFHAARRVRLRSSLLAGARVAVPFCSPLLVIGGGAAITWITTLWGYRIAGSLTRHVNSGISAFGPLGAVALFGVAALTTRAYLARRVPVAQLVLALALPTFLVLLAVQSEWNAFLPRFFLVPAALTAPLLARLFRGRAAGAAYLAVGALLLALTLTHDEAKPLRSAHGPPWQLTQVQALDLVEPEDTAMLASYDRLVPPNACVGAVLSPDEPSYLLFGKRLRHRVTFLPIESLGLGNDPVTEAYAAHDSYVVISKGLGSSPRPDLDAVRAAFASAGWKVRSLNGYWQLATVPHPTDCQGPRPG